MGFIQLTQKRYWRLHQAIKRLLQVGRISAKGMQKVVGVASWSMLLNRPLLSIFSAVYSFAQDGDLRISSLWPSVKRELGILQALLPFCRKDLRRGTSSFTYCSDACGSGYAVARGEGSAVDTARAAAVDERWRFKEQDMPGVRECAFASEGEVPEVWQKGFRPLPFSLAASTDWKLQFASRFSDTRPINLKEAHSTLCCQKHIIRSSRKFHTTHLLLSDNMSVCLALSKGRCADIHLL